MSTPISRGQANAINPIISENESAETVSRVRDLIEYMHVENTEFSLAPLGSAAMGRHWLYSALSAALTYEIEASKEASE